MSFVVLHGWCFWRFGEEELAGRTARSSLWTYHATTLTGCTPNSYELAVGTFWQTLWYKTVIDEDTRRLRLHDFRQSFSLDLAERKIHTFKSFRDLIPNL